VSIKGVGSYLMRKIFKFHSKSILPSLFLTLYFSYYYEPLNEKLVSFNRVIGNMTLHGGDVSIRVRNFYILSIILIPLIYFLIYSIISNTYLSMEQKGIYTDEGLEFINIISIVAIVPLILAWLNKFNENGSLVIDMSIYISLIWIIIFLLMDVLRIYIKGRIPTYKAIKWGLLISIPLTICLITIQYKFKHVFTINKFVQMYTFVVLIINTMLIVWHNIIKSLNLDYDYSEKALQLSFLPFLLSSGVISVLLEIFNILNQHNIFIVSRVRISLFVYLGSFVISVVIYIGLHLKKVGFLYKFNMESWYYIIIIVSTVLIFTQVPLQSIVNTDYFESANHGLGISELFNYGKIPVVETFDAHMLKVQFFGYIFALFNGYSIDAVFVPYFIYYNILLYTFIYIALSKIFNKDFAFIFTIIFPVYLDKAISLYFLGFITIFTLIKSINKQNLGYYLIYWVSIGVTCLYSLDIGIAFTVSTLIIFGLLRMLYKKSIRWRMLIVTGFMVGFTAVSTFSLLCVIKGINPVDRIREFLSISMSNQNWAVNALGHTTLISFVASYVFIPTISTFLFVLILYKIKTNKTSVDINRFVFMAMGFLVFLTNFQRGIVRHSLSNHRNNIILYSLPIFIALALTVLIKRNKYKVFTVIYFLTLMIFGGVLGTEIPVEQSLMDMTFKNYSTYQQFQGDFSNKVPRIKLDSSMEDLYKPIKYTFDSIFHSDETYIDFTNQSLLYALTGREKPVYVNQSPGLLNDVYSQQQFIEEIKNSSRRVSFVLMPIEEMVLSLELDGVNNSYKYYLVSEYISKNYVPLFRIKGFAVWCLKDEYSLKGQKLDEFIRNNVAKGIVLDIEPINEHYGEPQLLHKYELMQVPYIWGTYDEKESLSNCNKQIELVKDTTITSKDNVNFDIDLDSIDKSTGNYILINGDSNSEGVINIELGVIDDNDFTTSITYTFNIIKGDNMNYMLRVSSDYLWYLGEINSIRVTSNSYLENVTLSILKGD